MALSLQHACEAMYLALLDVGHDERTLLPPSTVAHQRRKAAREAGSPVHMPVYTLDQVNKWVDDGTALRWFERKRGKTVPVVQEAEHLTWFEQYAIEAGLAVGVKVRFFPSPEDPEVHPHCLLPHLHRSSRTTLHIPTPGWLLTEVSETWRARRLLPKAVGLAGKTAILWTLAHNLAHLRTGEKLHDDQTWANAVIEAFTQLREATRAPEPEEPEQLAFSPAAWRAARRAKMRKK